MDKNDLKFGRLYKMITIVCRDILWEILIHSVNLDNLVQETLKDENKKIPKYIKSTLKEASITKTYFVSLHCEFDISILIFIINRFWETKLKKIPFVNDIHSAVNYVSETRNLLVHSKESISDYDKEFGKIRDVVDLLENRLHSIQQINATNRKMKRSPRRYLNLIERINQDIISPEEIINITKDIRKYLATLKSKECPVQENIDDSGKETNYDQSASAEVMAELDKKFECVEELNEDQKFLIERSVQQTSKNTDESWRKNADFELQQLIHFNP